MTNRLIPKLAVCSWSLRPGDPLDLMAQLQVLAFGACKSRWIHCGNRRRYGAGCRNCAPERGRAGFGHVRDGGGGLLDAGIHPAHRRRRAGCNLAGELAEYPGGGGDRGETRLKLVTFHAGFLPHEASDPEFQTLFQRLSLIADLFAAKGIELGLKPARKPPTHLAIFCKSWAGPTSG